MLQYFKLYADAGFYLFPVDKSSKRPLIKNMLEAASSDIGQLMLWEEKFPNCNWGLSLAKSGLVAIDVDVKHGGVAIWEALISKNSEPETLKAASGGGGGGSHYVFAADPDCNYRGKIVKGIDVKHNGYILVEPSTHPSGGVYTWTKKAVPTIAPQWIDDLIRKKYNSPERSPILSASNDFLQRCVEKLKETELTYDDWVQAGMAIHSAMPDAEGRELFLELTNGTSYKDGDYQLAKDKWETFKVTGGITAKTLTHLIREKGLVPPNPTLKEDIEAFKQIQKEEYNKKKMQAIGFEEINGKFFCYQESAAIDFFNNQGFAFCESNMSRPFIRVSGGEGGKFKVKHLNLPELRDFTAEYQLCTIKETQKEVKRVHTPAHKIWAENNKKTRYTDIVFKPNADGLSKSIFNLWAGFPLANGKLELEDVTGEPSHILDMIFNSLCNTNQEKLNWVLDWLAHVIQYPQIKGTTVPVFIGKQGTGKGILNDLILKSMLQDLYISVATSKELTAQFNLHLAGKLITHIDEATWRGNKVEDGMLKNIIGSPTISVEEKFGARYTLDNFSRYIISSNNREAVSLEIGNRRYCVIETSEKHANDLPYFKKILFGMRENNEVAKLFKLLRNRDISHYNAFEIMADNTDGEASKLASIGTVAEFWQDTFFENPRRIFVKGQLVRAHVFAEYLRFVNAMRTHEKNFTSHKFWATSKDIFGDIVNEKARYRAGGDRIYITPISVTTRCAVDLLVEKFCKSLKIKHSTTEIPAELFEIDSLVQEKSFLD